MARVRMGRSPAQRDRTARTFGEPRGLPSDNFFAEWARIRAASFLAQGEERSRLLDELAALQDHFYSRLG